MADVGLPFQYSELIFLSPNQKVNHFCNEANIVKIFSTLSATPLE